MAPALPGRVVRLARIVALAVIIGVGISELWFAATAWTQTDAAAYWNAALRLREGHALYPVVSNVEASDVYRYAPWFAWLTVPFTFLPVRVAGAIWSLVLIAASIAAVVPFARRGAWAQVAFFFPILIGISAYGNVQALLIAPLVWAVEGRSGPFWIGVAGSLKIFPLLLALTYLGRGQWIRAVAAVAVALLLWAPALLYDLRGYVTESGKAGLFGNIFVYYGIAIGCVIAAVWLARRRYGWLGSAATVVLAAPRFFIYDVTYLGIGAPSAAPPAGYPGSARSSRSARSIE